MSYVSVVAFMLLGCSSTPMPQEGGDASQPNFALMPAEFRGDPPKEANAIVSIEFMRTGTVTTADNRTLPYLYFKGIALEREQGGETAKLMVFDAICGGLGAFGFDLADFPNNHPNVWPSVAWAKSPDSLDVLNLRGGFLHIEFLGDARLSSDTSSSLPVSPEAIDLQRFKDLDVSLLLEVQKNQHVQSNRNVPWVPWVITRGKRLATGAISTQYIHVVVPGVNDSDPPQLERLYGNHSNSIVANHTDLDVEYTVEDDEYCDWSERDTKVLPPAPKDQGKNQFVSQVNDFVTRVRAAP
jgi:hypothetical protein